MNEIYLDNATTTQLDPWVLEEMKPFLLQEYAAPSGHFGYQASLDAKEKLEQARATIARSINAEPEELIFTSGGTEANNLALLGLARALKKPAHLVTTAIEHESVLNTLRAIQKEDLELTVVGVDPDGRVKLDELEKALRPETILCSVQLVNQEVGTIQPLKKIGKLCAEKSIPFHTDAVNGWGRVGFDVKKMNLSLAALTAHKIHGPKGIGVLYKRKDVKLSPIMYGGYNEFELRPGTENLPGAVGMARAVEMMKPEHIEHIDKLKRMLWWGIKKEIPWVHLNGSIDRGAPHIINVTFDYIEGESILLHLDMQGIAAATGSACFSKALEASYVLLAMGRPHEQAHGSMRFSFSRFNTEEEIKRTLDALKGIVADLRKLSPLTPDKEA
ncbi:cysteine desulfurase NifS [candidate division TA06 bacterium B3_TA06]|uniref:Cysteine desulfurase NifS n=1 Tax=candidate division TA06 bacterium B3_TA06 TaxID=2012487 RepID=A0A532UY85_UNCT6|nr:MAG: cysteine desulfurase NifS [candidate division TA06 bacterium B3_TA06]